MEELEKQLTEVQKEYIPGTVKISWKQDLDNQKVTFIGKYLLKIEVDIWPSDCDTNGLSSLLIALAKEVVSKIGYLQYQEKINSDLMGTYGKGMHYKDEADFLDQLHKSEAYFIRLAQALNLAGNYPEVSKYIQEEIKKGNDNVFSALTMEEEKSIVKIDQEIIEKYGLASFYPTHITFRDDQGIMKVIYIQLNFATKQGYIRVSVNLLPDMFKNNNFKEVIVSELIHAIDNISLKNTLKIIKDTNDIDTDQLITRLLDDQQIFDNLKKSLQEHCAQ